MRTSVRSSRRAQPQQVGRSASSSVTMERSLLYLRSPKGRSGWWTVGCATSVEHVRAEGSGAGTPPGLDPCGLMGQRTIPSPKPVTFRRLPSRDCSYEHGLVPGTTRGEGRNSPETETVGRATTPEGEESLSRKAISRESVETDRRAEASGGRAKRRANSEFLLQRLKPSHSFASFADLDGPLNTSLLTFNTSPYRELKLIRSPPNRPPTYCLCTDIIPHFGRAVTKQMERMRKYLALCRADIQRRRGDCTTCDHHLGRGAWL